MLISEKMSQLEANTIPIRAWLPPRSVEKLDALEENSMC